jgi:hypothetical protein
LLLKDGSVNVPSASVRAVEMIGSLVENFKMRFSGFRSHAIGIQIFETKFRVEVSDTSENILHSFNQETLLTFCACLPVYRFSELCKLAQN